MEAIRSVYDALDRWGERMFGYLAAHPRMAYLLIAAVFAVWLAGAVADRPWATESVYRYARQRFDPAAQWLGPRLFRCYLIVLLLALAGAVFLCFLNCA